jgi:oligopeptide transport system substrate-binding protein
VSMNSRWLRVLALLLGVSLLAAACGDDDDEAAGGDTEEDGGDSGGGGEFIDYSSFVGDPPEHIDPALNTTLNSYQVINAMYDGLTDVDFSDPENPEVKPHLAEEIESNEDATVWTFTVKDGMEFSDGEAIVPSTFKRSWERAAALGGIYSYLLNFIEGGAEALESEDHAISGVVADDEAMTLEVTLAEPYSNFDAVAGFQLFYPMPEEAGDGASPVEDYENQLMIGNGPYSLESPRTDQEIVLVKNDSWTGDVNGETWDDRLERIVFRPQADPDTAYNAFEAGEADASAIPPGRYTQAEQDWGTTLDVSTLGSYYFTFGDESTVAGGDENVKLRQAISLAIDREEINAAVYNDTRPIATGITPEGIPGFEEGLCEYCEHDPERAEQLFQEWQEEGNSLDGPIPIQVNADAGHPDVVAIIVDNLNAVGIEATVDEMPTETYFTELSEGACVFCRTGWIADYPTYDNFMYDLFDSESGNNYGFANEEFDSLIAEAKATPDAEQANELFRDAERILLNEDTYAVPIVWYSGDRAYNDEEWTNFIQTPQQLILWEQIQPA